LNAVVSNGSSPVNSVGAISDAIADSALLFACTERSRINIKYIVRQIATDHRPGCQQIPILQFVSFAYVKRRDECNSLLIVVSISSDFLLDNACVVLYKKLITIRVLQSVVLVGSVLIRAYEHFESFFCSFPKQNMLVANFHQYNSAL
jgi:hypothetical protein